MVDIVEGFRCIFSGSNSYRSKTAQKHLFNICKAICIINPSKQTTFSNLKKTIFPKKKQKKNAVKFSLFSTYYSSCDDKVDYNFVEEDESMAEVE